MNGHTVNNVWGEREITASETNIYKLFLKSNNHNIR